MNESALNAYEAEYSRMEAKYPHCCVCDAVLWEDAWDILGDYYCQDCAEEWLKSCRISVERLL